MNRFLQLVITLIFLAVSGVATATELTGEVRSKLNELDRALKNREMYLDMRRGRLDSLSRLLDASSVTDRRLELLSEIGNNYYDFQVDSALVFYERGKQEATAAGRSDYAEQFLIRQLSLLPVTGVVRESVDRYEELSRRGVAESNKRCLFVAGSRLFFFTIDYYKTDSLIRPYVKRALELNDSALRYLKPGTADYIYHYEIGRFINEGERHLAVASLAELFQTLKPTDPYYSRIAMTLYYHYDNTGNPDKGLVYLVQAAIGDIVSGTLEEKALVTLGREMYDRGDIRRAFDYLSQSLDNSVASGSSSRSLEALSTLPMITDAGMQFEQQKIHRMMVLVVALFLALVVIVLVVVRLRRERNRLAGMKERLSEANRVKEHYISEFLSMASIHMEKLDEFQRTVSRKLKAGQADDLLKQLASGKLRAEEMRTSYEIFDNAFLHIYPNFIAGVNQLLQPDKRIADVGMTQLTTEIRILAFMRLGMDDSSRIARFLNVSVNTIYTYRNKFRAAAINRDTFEQDLMQIDRMS